MEADDTNERGARHDDDDDDGDNVVATPDMCHHCFDTLLKELVPASGLRTHGRTSKKAKKRECPPSRSSDEDVAAGTAGSIDDIRERLERHITYQPPDVDCPLFVTWSRLRSDRPPLLSRVTSSGLATPASTRASSSNITDDESSTHDESDYELRGCIGTLSAKPLSSALAEFAITSALHDTRFDPIALHELPSLRVGVSLLVQYEECHHCLDWTVGVHGIIIKFEGDTQRGNERRGRTYSATYLPEVAHDQRWTQREAVASLVRKAGYRGGISNELLDGIRCTRYQSSKCRLSYREYAIARHGGVDPLMTVAAVDDAMRQRGKGSKPCINL